MKSFLQRFGSLILGVLHGFDRLRLRGPSGAHDEFLLAATVQNLRRMAKWLCPTEPETANIAI